MKKFTQMVLMLSLSIVALSLSSRSASAFQCVSETMGVAYEPAHIESEAFVNYAYKSAEGFEWNSKTDVSIGNSDVQTTSCKTQSCYIHLSLSVDGVSNKIVMRVKKNAAGIYTGQLYGFGKIENTTCKETF